MKSVFSVGGDPLDGSQQTAPGLSPHFDISVCFNGVPDTVILEVHRNDFEGYSGESGNPVTTRTTKQVPLMRAALKASHARAIASALLSAATEVRS
jgi:hypothetical protein